MKKARVVFMGTPDFAVPALQALSAAFDVVLVVTQPDRPRGRGQLASPTQIKKVADLLGLPVSQPTKLKDGALAAQMAGLKPDFLVTAAYGRLLPSAILDVPLVASLNIHASLLPRYRGAAPIHRAVINGDAESGITIMYMDTGMDTGDILVQQSVSIGPDTTSGELHDILSALGADLIIKAMQDILDGKAKRTRQEEALATMALPLKPGEEEIDWCAPATAVHNLVRGMNPWPGAYTLFKGKRIKIFKGSVEKTNKHYCCGTVLAADARGILIATGTDAYHIKLLQPSGKRVMSAAEYLRGNILLAGDKLGRVISDGSA